GKYGIVRRAVDKKTGVNYAAKFLRRRRRGQCCAKEINHEIAVLMLCANSHHIVRLHAVHETRSETALILELATGGELQTLIDSKGQLSETKTRTCMREILRALHHLHKQSIAHLDLKPQNILLSGNDVEDGLKLCDFGIARIVEDTGKIYEILGTPDYVAPEVLHYEPLSLKTDIWSIGVLTYVLLTGCSPFGGDNKQETFLNITKCLLTFPEELFEEVSMDAIDFIQSALRIKPKERPTVKECLEHRWLKEDSVSVASETLAASVVVQIQSETSEQILPCPPFTSLLEEATFPEEQVVEVVYLNGHSQSNGDNAEEPVLKGEEQQPTAEEEVDDEAETNKENVLVQTIAQQQQPLTSVVEIVSVSLFPDAPTTPKVSRKAPPSEQQQNGHLIHHNHQNGHHHHHLQHHSHHQNNINNNVVMVSSRQTTNGTTTTTSQTTTSATTASGSPSVKAYVQKFQQQHQESATATVMLPMENGFCAAAAATLCCLKCSEETGTGATATGLAVAVATVATRKTLQCGDKGIIC
ncbi:serine/threonine-protein kinase 17A, partial [Topomyia yanbarensis]|uniref:serine/threonine-protein kinase 17A n=1 Tax=Topomyia yanbarensis TaxID=2498891 RepID=UPI00273C7527